MGRTESDTLMQGHRAIKCVLPDCEADAIAQSRIPTPWRPDEIRHSAIDVAATSGDVTLTPRNRTTAGRAPVTFDDC